MDAFLRGFTSGLTKEAAPRYIKEIAGKVKQRALQTSLSEARHHASKEPYVQSRAMSRILGQEKDPQMHYVSRKAGMGWAKGRPIPPAIKAPPKLPPFAKGKPSLSERIGERVGKTVKGAKELPEAVRGAARGVGAAVKKFGRGFKRGFSKESFFNGFFEELEKIAGMGRTPRPPMRPPGTMSAAKGPMPPAPRRTLQERLRGAKEMRKEIIGPIPRGQGPAAVSAEIARKPIGAKY